MALNLALSSCKGDTWGYSCHCHSESGNEMSFLTSKVFVYTIGNDWLVDEGVVNADR